MYCILKEKKIKNIIKTQSLPTVALEKCCNPHLTHYSYPNIPHTVLIVILLTVPILIYVPHTVPILFLLTVPILICIPHTVPILILLTVPILIYHTLYQSSS